MRPNGCPDTSTGNGADPSPQTVHDGKGAHAPQQAPATARRPIQIAPSIRNHPQADTVPATHIIQAQHSWGLSEAFFKNTLTCLALLDRDFTFLQVNEAYANACQRSVTDFPGHNIFDLFPCDAHTIFEDVRRRKAPHNAIAYPFKFPDHPEWGMTYWNWTLEPILDSSGEVSFFVLLLQDVTDPKRAERALAEAECDAQQTMRLLDAMRDGLFIFESTTLRFTYVNQGALRQTGYSRQELLGMTPFDLNPTCNTAAFHAILERLLSNRLPAQLIETVHRRKDGRAVPVEINLQHMPVKQEESRFIAVVRDISERKEAERKLQQSERFLGSVLESLPNMIFVKNADDLRFIRFNKAGEELLGYRREELLGKNDYDFFPQEEADFFVAKDRMVLATGKLLDIPEEPIQTRTNGLRILHTKKIPILDKDGTPCYLLGLSEDITERKRMELQLRHSEERFRRLIEVSSQLVWVADAQGLLHGDSSSWEKFTGRSRDEAVGWRWLDTIHPDDRARVAEVWREAVTRRTPCRFEVRVLHYGGGYRDTICHAAPLFHPDGSIREWIGMNLDITDRKLDEERLRQASRVEAVGKLAGGIAHDFNNLLTVINGYCEIMLHTVNVSNPLHTPLHEVKRAGERAAALTKQLLAFSRQQLVRPIRLHLNTVVTDLTAMLQRLIGEHIRLVTSLEPNLGTMTIDPTQIEQVIVNMVVNARDAMPEGGTLTITTANVSTSRGPAIRLTVRDTGLGMDEKTLARLFEPFYTTKPVGRGTGLGLAVVHGIVTQNKGSIRVESRPNQGSTFIIDWPCAAGETAEPEPTTAATPVKQGEETILLVEDDDAVRCYLKETLTTYHYHVLEAATPNEALQLAAHARYQIQMLVTDMVMPGMNGYQLINRILEQDAGIKVLLISGYIENPLTLTDSAGHQITVLEKPFKPDTLARMVRQILDTAAAPAKE